MAEYIVKTGDSLWKIAKRQGTTVDILVHLNHLKGKQVHDLKVGQRLRLPDQNTKTPDSLLTLQFRSLDFKQFTPKNVKVEHDGDTSVHELGSLTSLALTVRDHAMGLKVWLEDIDKKMVQVLDETTLPLGNWNVAIDSRKLKIAGNLLPEKGKPQATTADVKKSLTQHAQATSGTTAQEQTRTEQGEPVHALATIYTSENLRLLPGNEQYRALLIEAAKKHGQTPQSLSAMLNAEAALQKDGTWIERSNEDSPNDAQGLAQFFPAGWSGVFGEPDSLLHKECANLAPQARLAKRLEARYAIDGAATYAALNLKNFTKSTHFAVDALSSEEKAKLAYLLHHEGLTGAKRLFGIGEQLDEQETTKRLTGQLGKKNPEKIAQLINQYNGDPVAAYKGWLFNYIDKKINVASFLVKDAQKFANPPRTMAAIAAGLTGGAVVPPPKPQSQANPTAKPVSSPPAASPKESPAKVPAAPQPDANAAQTTAVVPPTTSGNDDAVWFDPLARCELRTKHLASKKAATFGMTRNNGTRAHQGIDLVAIPGTPIYAVAAGDVHMSHGGDYGNTLVLRVGINDLPEPQAAYFKKINPNKNTIGFFYAHLQEFAFPDPSKIVRVNAGDVLGKTGSTGNAHGMVTVELGAHLHFEARQSALDRCTGLTNRVDPLPFIQNCENR